MGRPVEVIVGPLATADADGVATSQKVAAALYLALQGALTDGTTANNVAQSQTPAGAGNLTLDGSLASSVPTGSAVAYLGQNSRIYITSGSDISNRTFTITGLVQSVSGLSAQVETLTGPNASVVASQKLYYSISSIAISGAAAGALTVGRAGIATFDVARRFIITSAGDDSGITFTVAGTDWANNLQSETVTGANAGAASTVLSYKTVTSVIPSAAVATTVTAGTNGIADSPWVRFDTYGSMAEVAIQVGGSGTVNWTVQQTLDDPVAFGSSVYNNPSAMKWVNHPDAALVGSAVTTGVQGNYAYTPLFARLVLNSGTGSAKATFAQTYQS